MDLSIFTSPAFMYTAAALLGGLAKNLIYNPVKNYIINKMTPGIIQTYLETALGLNQAQPIPAVVITAVSDTSTAAQTAVVVPPVAQ